MTMLLIAKELAEAVVKSHTFKVEDVWQCDHCGGEGPRHWRVRHDSNCIVVRAKLLLELEWGIKL